MVFVAVLRKRLGVSSVLKEWLGKKLFQNFSKI